MSYLVILIPHTEFKTLHGSQADKVTVRAECETASFYEENFNVKSKEGTKFAP